MRRDRPSLIVLADTLLAAAVANMRETAVALRRANDAASAEQTVAVLNRETENFRSLRQQLASSHPASRIDRAIVKKQKESLVRGMQRIRQPSERILVRIQRRQFSPEIAEQLALAVAHYNLAMSEFGAQAIHLFV